jgi:hypothetical protein
VGLAVALVEAWRLSPALFGIIIGFILLAVAILALARDGWSQTSPHNLAAHGFVPQSVRGVRVMDPGLRRDYAPMIPAAVSWRIAGNPNPRLAASPKPRPAGSTVARREPAGRGRRGRRRNETLQPYDTVSLAEERQAAGIDDLFTALDIELVGLLPVKKKVEEIGSLLLVDRARQRFGL